MHALRGRGIAYKSRIVTRVPIIYQTFLNKTIETSRGIISEEHENFFYVFLSLSLSLRKTTSACWTQSQGTLFIYFLIFNALEERNSTDKCEKTTENNGQEQWALFVYDLLRQKLSKQKYRYDRRDQRSVHDFVARNLNSKNERKSEELKEGAEKDHFESNPGASMWRFDELKINFISNRILNKTLN